MTIPTENETYSEVETVAHREAALQRVFATPHKPHKPIVRRKKVEPTKVG